MGVDAGLWILFVARPTTDAVLSVLANAGWKLGDPCAFVPVGGEVGDWRYVDAGESELRLACRTREGCGGVAGFQAVFGEERGLFLIDSTELLYSPGARDKLSDGRTTDVSAHLARVLLPLRRALSIERWRWLEDA